MRKASLYFLVGLVVASIAASLPLLAQSIGGGGGGGGVAASLVCLLTGGSDCTMTGQIIFSGVTDDITSAGDENVAINPGGTGRVSLQAEYTQIADAAGNVRGMIHATGAANTVRLYAPVASGGILQLSDTISYFGPGDDRAATSLGVCIGDTLGGAVLCSAKMYGSGLITATQVQTCDCGTTGTPNTVTCDIQSGTVFLIDGDADACTVTISETTMSAINETSLPLTIFVGDLGGGGSFTIADSAGIVDLEGGTSFTGDSVGDTLTLRYLGYSTVDSFVEIARANN